MNNMKYERYRNANENDDIDWKLMRLWQANANYTFIILTKLHHKEYKLKKDIQCIIQQQQQLIKWVEKERN